MKTIIYAVRFLLRSKSYTIINLLGLAFSLACCIVLMRYIHRELTVDSHCVDREQVYVLINNYNGNRNLAFKPKNLGNEKDYIKTIAQAKLTQQEYLSYNQKTFPTDVLSADKDYLQLFDYQLLQGSFQLEKPGTAVLTEECAQRIFGKENPIGKVLRTSLRKDVVVTGIIRKCPNKSTYPFDALLDNSFNKIGAYLTLVQFLPGTNIKQMEQMFSETATHTFKSENNCSLIKVKDLYWDNTLLHKWGLQGGSKAQLAILTGICLIILLTGVVNFVNLYLVCMQKRNKEIGRAHV